ncbi:hypothetical protein [Halorubrum vacuolatum]|uniref:Uncharacterized protein n=1 Tax=Halorubrum vacuolatum TaxID=63740 RepID=A0A238UM85_HALVU|nr:hypothetical protein [Halorubrum vacuolatum]SNR23125.1 hypothetical protein SAMN06264855_10164 [Halorubrum vacuolatum]
MEPSPPRVPTDRLQGWKIVSEAVERPFSAGPVSVIAGTVRYEPTDTAEPRPFFFASRLYIRPETGPNPMLTRLVERGARDGFRERLAENDIDGVDHRHTRELPIDEPPDTMATADTFRGRCLVDGEPVPVEAMLAVWEAEGYLLAGGAYPLVDDVDGARRRLRRIVRGVRSE